LALFRNFHKQRVWFAD